MKIMIAVIAVLCVVIDQISKILVTSYMEVGELFVVIEDFFFLRYIRNTGAAWGILSNGTLFLIIISFVFLYFLIKYVIEERRLSKLSSFCYGIVIGGITGNLIDRLIRNYVVDFFSFNIFGHDFPIFNIADIFIVVGVITVFIESIFGGDYSDSRRRKEKA